VKRWYYIVLAGLGILGIVYVYLHRQELGLTTPHGFGSGDASNSGLVASSSRPAQITWQTVDRTADGFRVEMPIDTREIQIPAYNQSGGTDQVNMIYSNPSSDTTFSVAWADDPPVIRAGGRNPDRILDMARDEALARTQTSLVTETNSTPGGYPARDLCRPASLYDDRRLPLDERAPRARRGALLQLPHTHRFPAHPQDPAFGARQKQLGPVHTTGRKAG
jgi:hypothetical protein